MRIDFGRHFLHKIGFDKKWLIRIMEELPEGTEIIGFGEDSCMGVYTIGITHESFPEVSEGSKIPLLGVVLKERPASIEFEWPDSFKENHKCQYRTYQGFSKVEEICTICGKKNE